ncbi:MAG TPA: aspartate kinase [Lachnospiraceae bacterium]|nr:aspartate kinase [Lachnospiraceae bacterium]
MLIVKKFGGSSVADAECIRRVANTIVKSYKEGNKVVVVLSAQGDTTDELIEKANEINPNASKREMDMLLATGEQQSVALMAMAIEAMGYPVVSLNAFQCNIYSTSTHSNARIKNISVERIENELDNKNIVIITGFQGINRNLDVTTLGRGGSDTSAVALAAKLGADVCEIYTDVDGVYTCDPRIVKGAVKLNEISYDEMLELATLGAKVLHNRSVELAKKYNVNLVVRSSMSDAEGTVVKEEAKVEKMLVSGVAVDKNVARIALIGLKDEPGTAFKLFSLLSKKKISVDLIIQSIGRSDTKDISFTVTRDDFKETIAILEENKDSLGYSEVKTNTEVAKVSVVGAGMATNSGVAAMLFEATFDAHINVRMISTSEIKISLLVDEKDADRAAEVIHDKFINTGIKARE